MKQEFIGVTSIKQSNETINNFMKTSDVDYFENEIALQKAVDFTKSLGFVFDIDDCEACISGNELEPANISVIADTTKEATFLALETFAKLKNNNRI